MSTETPRDADGSLLCAWCGAPVPPSLGTKPRAYCRRGCVQRAHEARKLEKQLQAVREEEAAKRSEKLLNAYLKGRAEEAELRAAKSRDDAGSDRGKSRDFAKPQVTPLSSSPPAAPLPPPRAKRRRASQTAQAMPLLPRKPDDNHETDGQPRRADS